MTATPGRARSSSVGERGRAHGRVACSALAAVLAGFACDTAPALAATTPSSDTPGTSARLAASLHPDRLGAHARLTLTVDYAGGAGVPLAVRRSVISMPAGMSLDVPSLRSCSGTRLLEHGAGACPPQSRLGRGHALLATELEDEIVTERASLSIAIGPPQNLHPTFEILARGSTPVAEQRVLTGMVVPASPPYGEALAMSIPPIPTLATAPYASVLNLSLAIGTPVAQGHRRVNSVVIPSSCPRGGFPFAAEFVYANGASESSRATVPCPR
ncbi:MAG TPA: hypothetical protein VGF95_06750 [Solirubrobacteraceae bacterium]|jgi:hypothetical protein